jgi:hypothetical protein
MTASHGEYQPSFKDGKLFIGEYKVDWRGLNDRNAVKRINQLKPTQWIN